MQKKAARDLQPGDIVEIDGALYQVMNSAATLSLGHTLPCITIYFVDGNCMTVPEGLAVSQQLVEG